MVDGTGPVSCLVLLDGRWKADDAVKPTGETTIQPMHSTGTAGRLADPRAQSCSGLQGRSLHVRRYFCVHDGRPGADGMMKGMTAAATADCNCTSAIQCRHGHRIDSGSKLRQVIAWAGSQVWWSGSWSCLLTGLATAHPMCFDAAEVRFPRLIGPPWPLSGGDPGQARRQGGGRSLPGVGQRNHHPGKGGKGEGRKGGGAATPAGAAPCMVHYCV